MPRRVSAADQRDLLTLAQLRLDRRRPIRDASALKGRQIWNGRLPIAGAGGDHHGARPHRATVRQMQEQGRVGTPLGTAAIESRHLQWNRDLGAEFQRLAKGAPRQCPTRDPGGKTEVVLDPSRRPGCPP